VIPNVVKGGDMRGLLQYLVETDQGRTHNVHDNPHVVSGDHHLMAWHGAEQLDGAAANEIVDYLDEPRKRWGTEICAQVRARDPETDEVKVVGYREQNVWHCSLSLSAEEGAVDEDRWDAIARDFMDRMGFTEEGSGKAPARWVAIHHGTSSAGNDHVHIAASMVREDGTRWDGRFGDWRRAQEACRELEIKHGLRPVVGRESGLAVRGEKAAERETAKRAGLTNTAPVELAHRVRATAVASTSEAEWVRRVRGSGVVLKPYYAKGTTDVVTGYKAALRPETYSDKLVFYGGGRLGKDLSLPRIREHFAEPTIDEADAAVVEWTAAAKGRPPAVQSGRESAQMAPGASVEAAHRLGALNERLASIDPVDHVAWGDAARDVSGALSAWARFDPENRQALNDAARQVARSAQVSRRGGPPRARPKAGAMGAAAVLLQARTGGKGTVAGGLLMRQVLAATVALRDRQVAVRQLAEARALHAGAVQRLQQIPMVGYGDETTAVQNAAAEQQSVRAYEIAMSGRGDPRPGRTDGQGTPAIEGAPDPLPRVLGERPRDTRTAGKDRHGYDR